MLVHVSYDQAADQVIPEYEFSAGIDMGGHLWVLGVRNCRTGKYSYFCFSGTGKEHACYARIATFIARGKVHVTYEAGRNGFTPARALQRLGADVRVLPVNKVEIIQSGKKAKTDKIDAKMLAYLPTGPACDVPAVFIPSVEQECDRMLMRENRRLQKEAGRKNHQILSILERWPIGARLEHKKHLDAQRWIKLIEQWSKDEPIPKELPKTEAARILMYVAELRLIEKHHDEWSSRLDQRENEQRNQAQEDGELFLIDVFKDYVGIGELSSRLIAWTVIDMYRFKNGKKFASYLGLTPTPWQSCKTRREQGISKAGDKELRRVAIQLAWLWVRWQPESRLTKKWQPKLEQKGRSRRTAIVGLARQLMVALYRKAVHDIEIEDARKTGDAPKKTTSKRTKKICVAAG